MKHYFTFWRFFEIAALVILLSGCKGLKQTVEVPVYIHDTTQTVRELHDSIYIDRWHTEYQKGDTIYITDEVTKIVTKIKIDTSYKYVEVPVETTITKTVEVQKPLSWWERTQQGGFWVLLAVFSMWLLWKFRKVIL